jgi:hypothetical protein
MYDEPPPDERPGCRETVILTRAAFAVLFPFLAAMIAVLVLVMTVLLLLFTNPALALIPLAVLVAGVFAFARWERGRYRPPGP